MPYSFGYRSLAAAVVAAGLLVSPGCQSQPKGQLSNVPPPPPNPGAASYGQTGSYPDGGSIQPQPMDSGSAGAMSPADPMDPANAPGQMTLDQSSTPPNAGAASMSRTYVVRKGDTLWSIAKQVYGDGQRWQDIAAANPSMNPKKLAVGQTIALP